MKKRCRRGTGVTRRGRVGKSTADAARGLQRIDFLVFVSFDPLLLLLSTRLCIL